MCWEEETTIRRSDWYRRRLLNCLVYDELCKPTLADYELMLQENYSQKSFKEIKKEREWELLSIEEMS